MPGWRVGFMVGNPVLVNALARLKSYFDYGTFTPIQVATHSGSRRPAGVRHRDLRELSQAPRCAGRGAEQGRLARALPKATMFVWAQIPEQYRGLGSLEFSKLLLTEAKTAVSPGIGFGDYGDGHVRFSLIENEERTRQALRGIKADAGQTVVSCQLKVIRSGFVLSQIFRLRGRDLRTQPIAGLPGKEKHES